MIIKYWKEVFSTYIVPKFYGGGGGQTSTSQVYQRNIPKELAPYYNVLLNSAMKQAFTTKDNPNSNPPLKITPYQSWYGDGNHSVANKYSPPTSMAKGGEVKHFAAGDLVSQIQDVTGIQPYTPFGSYTTQDASGNDVTSVDPNAYVAGMSPLQQGAINSAINLETPSQFGTATKMATTAGMGGLDTVNKSLDYGQQGNAAGVNAANLGLNASDVAQQNASTFGNQALTYGQAGSDAATQYGTDVTDKTQLDKYMNPYLSKSLDPQLALMNQQNAIENQKTNSQAAQAGAYGGSRQLVANSLNNQANDLAKGQVIGAGYNQAYNTANQNMQNVANMGMQGAQAGLAGVNAGINAGQYGLQGVQAGIQGQNTAIQGANAGLQGVSGAQSGYGLTNSTASNLAGIGTSELGANQSIIGTQNQLGQNQQAIEQAKKDAVKGAYETSQNYPWQVLGQVSNMLNQTPTTNVDVRSANPNIISQTLGTIPAIAGAIGSKKKGGVIKKPKVKAQGSGIGDLAVYNAMKGGK